MLQKVLEHVQALHNYSHRTVPHMHQVIKDLQKLIEGTPELYEGFLEMFAQVPENINEDRLGDPQVRDYLEMLDVLDDTLTRSPYIGTNGGSAPPINTVLSWSMNTPAGIRTFQNVKLNEQFRAIFRVWADFLATPESCHVLDDAKDGWFGANSLERMPDFEATFICDPSAPYFGFTSWDDFFTRRLRPGVRPIESPSDDFAINSPCESHVLKMATEVKAVDSFWLKGQPYSLTNMLDNDPFVPQFAGGTVYQAFLDTTDYHRWHSPVNGTIEKIVNVPGLFFAASPTRGFHTSLGPDPEPPVASQAYCSAISTRALVYIRADEPSIGLMCFIAVGMADVSTCTATVQKGDRVKKGDEMGSFHYGGSTFCLVFRPETKIKFDPKLKENSAVRIHSVIATVAR